MTLPSILQDMTSIMQGLLLAELGDTRGNFLDTSMQRADFLQGRVCLKLT